MTKSKSDTYPGEYDYQAEADVHHLSEAAKIKADPKRHKRAVAHAKKKIAHMQGAVADGKKC